MTSERQTRIEIGEKTYQLVSDDDYLASMGTSFEPNMVRLFSNLISKTDHVIDVGANIGCTSILFGDLAKSVCSFEPSPSTFRFLERNISASGLKNIAINNYALGPEIGESEITFAPSNRAGAFVSDQTKASAGHVTERILIKPLDAVFSDLGAKTLDFMKIDTEGFEKSVISGARKTIEQFKPVVVLELNHWCLNAFQRICVPDFFDYLRSVFPVLLAIQDDSYADLHDQSDSYTVMYHHIIHFKYLNIVAAFDRDRLANFHQIYNHN